jgi:hypothetical protein
MNQFAGPHRKKAAGGKPVLPSRANGAHQHGIMTRQES